MWEVSLQNPDHPPFHLKANFRYEVNKHVIEGECELYWAAPNKFRRDYRSGDTADIDLVLDGKRFVVRPEPEKLFPLVRLNDVIFSPLGYLGDNPKVSKVRFKKGGGAEQTCIDSDQEFYRNSVCFDATIGDIVSATSVDGIEGLRIVLNDFAPLGRDRYPRHITRRFAPGTLEITIDTLETVGNFAADLFMPPASAISMDFCARPVRTGDPPTLKGLPAWYSAQVQCNSTGCNTNEIQIDPVNIYPEPEDAYYLLVGPDGRVKQYISLFPKASSAGAMNSFLKDGRFPVYSCTGKPNEYEAVFIPSMNAPRPGEILLR
ncbi:MAG: hypothetical protein WB780_06615 [Candidatus Acidiferrales bacterium]